MHINDIHNDSDKLKYYQDLDNNGLVIHRHKPEETWLSVREIIELLFNVKVIDLNLKKLESGSQIRKHNKVNYKQHYTVLCNRMAYKFKEEFKKSSCKFKLELKDPGSNIDKKPGSCSVYPPCMFKYVEEFIKMKPINEWYEPFEKCDKTEKIICDCGVTLLKKGLKKHLQTKKHKTKMEQL